MLDAINSKTKEMTGNVVACDVNHNIIITSRGICLQILATPTTGAPASVASKQSTHDSNFIGLKAVTKWTQVDIKNWIQKTKLDK